MSKALLIGRKELVRYTPLSGNIDTDKIIQYIEIAQDIHLQQILGTDLLEKIQADIISSAPAGIYLEVANLAKPVLAHYSFMEFLPFAQYIIGNKGLFKHTSENATEASQSDVNAMKEKSRDTAQFYAQRLIDFLCANSDQIPEYTSNTEEDMNPRRPRPFGGWQI